MIFKKNKNLMIFTVFLIVTALSYENFSGEDSLLDNDKKTPNTKMQNTIVSQATSNEIRPENDLDAQNLPDSATVDYRKKAAYFFELLDGLTVEEKVAKLLRMVDEGEISINEQMYDHRQSFNLLLYTLATTSNLNSEHIWEFLSRGAVVYNNNGFMIAASDQTPDVVELLVNSGLDPDDNNSIPLMYLALQTFNIPLAEKLQHMGYELKKEYQREINGRQILFKPDDLLQKNSRNINKESKRNSDSLKDYLNNSNLIN